MAETKMMMEDKDSGDTHPDDDADRYVLCDFPRTRQHTATSIVIPSGVGDPMAEAKMVVEDNDRGDSCPDGWGWLIKPRGQQARSLLTLILEPKWLRDVHYYR